MLAAYGLVQVQAGMAQSYDWPNLALMPFYIWRQLIITVLMGAAWFFGAPTDAVTAMAIAVVTTWAATIGQLVLLNRRLQDKVPAGRKVYEPKFWFATSLPIFVVEGFYLLLTYVDILRSNIFARPTTLRSTTPALACSRSWPSFISQSPEPRRINSANTTSPVTGSGSHGRRSLSAPRYSPSAGRCSRCLAQDSRLVMA
ncbi:MAG TPA: hypothetical protein VKP52_14185 [Pseudolabrys sp.]|nr:hypothetical protein [Pseudolabrys sp.]